MTVTGEDLTRSADMTAAAATALPAEPALAATASAQASTAPSEVVASPATAEPSGPSIGYLGLDGSQAYTQALSQGLRVAAAGAGVDLVECHADVTAAGVLACAEDLAEARVSGVVSMQPFGEIAGDVCDALEGVPVVGIAYEQGPCQVSLLQVDHESGRLAGDALGALVAERWECEAKAFVTLELSADDPIGAARIAGFRQGYKEHCALPKTKRPLPDAQHLITAKTQMGEVLDGLSGRPIIVAGVSDIGVLGALEAAREAGKADRVWAAGQLADQAALQTIACDKHYLASVAHFPERFGAVVVPALIDAIEGREVLPQLGSELALVTAENVRELFPETPECGA